MSGYTDRFFLFGDLNLHLLDWGNPESPAVFLFHPTGGHAHVWDKVAPALAARYRVLALDARDHGDSDSSLEVFDPSVKVDEVLDIARQLGIDRFSVVGNSMGGRLATLIAFKHADRIDRLVIEDVGPELGPVAARYTAERLSTRKSEFATLDELIEYLRLSRTFADDAWLRHIALHGSVHTAAGTRLLKHRTHVPFKPSDVAAERWAQLPSITCPTLVVRGAISSIMDKNIKDRTEAALPNGQGVTVPNAGHMVHEDNIDGYLDVVLPFFGIR